MADQQKSDLDLVADGPLESVGEQALDETSIGDPSLHPSVESLLERFPDEVQRYQIAAGDQWVVWVGPDRIHEILTWRKDDEVQAFDITEVPNQTDSSVFMEDSPESTSLKRRIKRLSDSKDLNVGFEAVVTYELSQTINKLSSQESCEWLVMGWGARPNSGIFISNPIGWLLANINSNLALFKDNGARYIGKVVLALRPGRKDKNFIGIANNICKHYGATLTLLHVVPETSRTTYTIKHRTEENLIQS